MSLSPIPSSILPPQALRLRALELCAPEAVKIVILGQDPYFSAGQADGLAFSVPDGVQIPPSLRNIYKELTSDLGLETPATGDLSAWAEQGVLLLNSALSVCASKPGSHAKVGWQEFTDAIIKNLADKYSNIVFMLWGLHAINKSKLIDAQKHMILTAPHPSPLSAYRGFFGCKHFSQANNYLSSQNKVPVRW